MIYTITPNPCLDLGGTVANLVPDEKSYVHNELRSPGGNSINSARIINRLGVPVTATGFLGGGVGVEITSLLDQERIPHEFIKIRGYTRINVTVSNCKDHHQTRLSFQGPKISADERESLFKYISKIHKNSLLVIGGSLPPGFSKTHLIKVLKIAESQKLTCIVDVPGDFLKCAFSAPTILIKPNLLEFQTLVGKKVSSLKTVLELATPMTKKIPLICVSSVAGGALLVTRRGSWFGRIPKIQVRSTVGAGDSMVGAMSAYLWKEWIRTRQSMNELAMNNLSMNELAHNLDSEFPLALLRSGLAAACGTLSLPGTLLSTEKAYQKYLPKIVCRSLSKT